jgi:hypothetical protein
MEVDRALRRLRSEVWRHQAPIAKAGCADHDAATSEFLGNPRSGRVRMGRTGRLSDCLADAASRAVQPEALGASDNTEQCARILGLTSLNVAQNEYGALPGRQALNRR